jgi:DNA gyrase/topoisomerase IV subunit A
VAVAVERVHGDALLRAVVTEESQEVIIGTKKGMSIRFDESEIRAQFFGE